MQEIVNTMFWVEWFIARYDNSLDSILWVIKLSISMWYAEICVAYRNLCVWAINKPSNYTFTYSSMQIPIVSTPRGLTPPKNCVRFWTLPIFHKDSRFQAKIPFHTKCLHTEALHTEYCLSINWTTSKKLARHQPTKLLILFPWYIIIN